MDNSVHQSVNVNFKLLLTSYSYVYFIQFQDHKQDFIPESGHFYTYTIKGLLLTEKVIINHRVCSRLCATGFAAKFWLFYNLEALEVHVSNMIK